MGWRSVFCTVLVVSCLVPAHPAVAAGSIQPPVGGTVTLGFGAVYVAGGRDLTHRGLDIAGAPGATVVAAASGVVSFAGEIPADSGGRTRAVTLTLPDGLLVTVSPLAATSVRKGDRVESGSPVGELAATGDASSGGPHAHLSVRTGGVYVDPAPMLATGAPEPPLPEVAPTASSGSGRGTGEASGRTSEVGVSHSVDATPRTSTVSRAVTGVTVDAGAVRSSLGRTISGLRAAHGAGYARSVAPRSLAAFVADAAGSHVRLAAIDLPLTTLVLSAGSFGIAVGAARHSRTVRARAGASE